MIKVQDYFIRNFLTVYEIMVTKMMQKDALINTTNSVFETLSKQFPFKTEENYYLV